MTFPSDFLHFLSETGSKFIKFKLVREEEIWEVLKEERMFRLRKHRTFR